VTQLKPNPGTKGAEKARHGQGPPRLVEDSNAASWPMVPSAIRSGGALPGPWEALFEPIRRGTVDELIVIGQFGQSLDGRVATETGHSHYINGVDGLAHLHRLRAVVDAVVVGIGTAVADNPQLTVRRVAGPSPARVVIDPHGRLPATARLLGADGARRLVVTAEGARHALPDDIERLTLPAKDGAIAPAAILARLAACGFRRILIEGGANTVSRFLVAGCLDRLHVVVAPMILGTGKPSFTLPPIDRVDRALRPPMRTHILGEEVLFDCDLSAQRLPVGAAKKST
jgi:diaminohydroxyphosphoribosylaminopyrimidine deaminase / 5-amino-6-(5-phosphoribosylamino)uracil reductase